MVAKINIRDAVSLYRRKYFRSVKIEVTASPLQARARTIDS